MNEREPGAIEGLAERWFRYADEDLLTAIKNAQDVDIPSRQACYFAQQAAEKAIKACVLGLGLYPPRSHDLEVLRDLLPASWEIHQLAFPLDVLTQWIIEGRYPGDWDDPDESDAQAAIETAKAVLESLRRDLERSG